MGAGSEELVKNEVSFGAGTRIPNKNPVETITMSINRGYGMDNQFADIQGLIFHSDLYQEGPGSIGETLRANRMKLDKELQELKSGRISSNLRKKIERGANLSADDWENLRFDSPQALQKYIDEATQLQTELLMGGENPGNIRGLNERLTKFLSREYFRGNKSYDVAIMRNQVAQRFTNARGISEVATDSKIINLPVLPFSQRNSIDTESRVGTTTGTSVFGTKFGSTRSISLEDGRELNLFRYRLKNHKFIVPDAASEKLYQAFGGFDLDDKVISDLHFIRDSSGARRLASFVWRQPTGPQEFALMFPHLDEDTLSRLLGAETQFAERFQALSGAASDLISEQRFGRIPTSKIGVTARELDSLNREEKIIKYVSLMANGNKKAAKKYVEGLDNYGTQSFFDEVEKAIFTITDIGQFDDARNIMGLELGDASRRIDAGQILSRIGGGAEVLRDKAGNIEDYRLISMMRMNDRVVNKALSGKLRNCIKFNCR